jgi:hypothetical protein
LLFAFCLSPSFSSPYASSCLLRSAALRFLSLTLVLLPLRFFLPSPLRCSSLSVLTARSLYASSCPLRPVALRFVSPTLVLPALRFFVPSPLRRSSLSVSIPRSPLLTIHFLRSTSPLFVVLLFAFCLSPSFSSPYRSLFTPRIAIVRRFALYPDPHAFRLSTVRLFGLSGPLTLGQLHLLGVCVCLSCAIARLSTVHLFGLSGPLAPWSAPPSLVFAYAFLVLS